MNALTMNFEDTRNVGNQLKTQNESFKSLLNNIKSANNSLNSYWKGADATKYTNAVTEQAKNMDDLSLTMEEISNFIIQAANIVEETQSGNANSINVN